MQARGTVTCIHVRIPLFGITVTIRIKACRTVKRYVVDTGEIGGGIQMRFPLIPLIRISVVVRIQGCGRVCGKIILDKTVLVKIQTPYIGHHARGTHCYLRIIR